MNDNQYPHICLHVEGAECSIHESYIWKITQKEMNAFAKITH